MPKLDDKGYVLGDDGKRVEIDGKPLKVDGKYHDEDGVESIVKERLKRAEKQADEKLQKKIDDLEAKLKGSVSADEAKTLRDQIASFEAQLHDKEEAANKRAARQVDAAAQERDAFKARYERERQERRRMVVEAELMQAASNPKRPFINPRQLVRALADKIVWEEEIDPATNKPTGAEKFSFKMRVKDEATGKFVEKHLTAEQAAQIVGDEEPNLVRGANNGGAGGFGSANGAGPGSHVATGGQLTPEQLSRMSPGEVLATGIKNAS